MSKKILISLIVTFFSSCTLSNSGIRGEVVSIVGQDIRHVTSIGEIRGMGVRIDEVSALTSAHVVPDDRLSYRIDGAPYRVGARDVSRDIALLILSGHSSSEGDDIKKLEHIISRLDASRRRLTQGDTVSIHMLRSGSFVVSTGSIRDLSANIHVYDLRGGSMTLTGVLLTDIPLESGESGAPISDQDGDLIDLVHVR